MKSNHLLLLPVQILIVAVGALFLTASLPVLKGASPGQKRIQRFLRNAYEGKTLSLRNFYSGRTLEFDSRGRVVEGPKVGPWTLYSRIFVDGVKLRSRTLEIYAQRLFLHYLSDEKKFRALRDGDVRIRIHLDREPSDAQDVEPLLAKIFVMPEENFSALVPPYWKEFCSHLNDPDWSMREMEQASAEAKPMAKNAIPPVPIDRPEPGYSREAREAKIDGDLLLSIWIDEYGHVSNVVIVRPLGMGLDESAVQTVRTWTFKPAQLNGHASPVKVLVKITFRLGQWVLIFR